MKKEELKFFYLFDHHFYKVKHNSVLLKILDNLDYCYYEEDIQNFINKLISWYHIKYSDLFLKRYFEGSSLDYSILDIMDFKTLQRSFGAFEEELFRLSNEQNIKIILQKQLIVAAGWGLIYDKKSNPENGYYRAVQLINDFNSYYQWNLSPESIYGPTLKKDYSPHNEENKTLLAKDVNSSVNSNHVRRKSFLFRWLR